MKIDNFLHICMLSYITAATNTDVKYSVRFIECGALGSKQSCGPTHLPFIGSSHNCVYVYISFFASNS